MNKRIKPDTVPFDRGKAYYLDRGIQNRLQGNPRDALLLIKRAAAETPEDGNVLIEAALAAAELKMPELSSRCITRAMESGADENRVLHAFAENLFCRGRIDDALIAAEALYHKGENEAGVLADLTLEKINAAMSRSQDRELARSMAGLAAACGHMSRGEHEVGRRELERCLETSGDLAIVRAMAALSMAEDDLQQAETLAAEALKLCRRQTEYAVRVKCVCSQVFLIRREEEARALLLSIRADEISADDRESYIQALASAGLHEQIRAYCKNVLSGGTFDRKLYHALSVSACALGLSDEEKRAGWEHILELDEEDHICLAFMPRRERITGTQEEYCCALTSDMQMEMMLQVLHAGGDADANPCGGEAEIPDRQLPLLRGIALSEAEEHLRRGVISLLVFACPEERHLAIRPETPRDIRRDVQRTLIPELLAQTREKYPICEKALYGVPELLWRTQPAWLKRLCDGAMEYLSGYETPMLADTFLRLTGKIMQNAYARQLCRVNAIAAEAALVYLALKHSGIKPDTRALLMDYVIRPRQFKRLVDVSENALRKG